MTKCIVLCDKCGRMMTEEEMRNDDDQCSCGSYFFKRKTLTKEEESKYDPKYLYDDIPYAEQSILEINNDAIILEANEFRSGPVTQISFAKLDNADLHDLIDMLTRIQNERQVTSGDE